MRALLLAALVSCSPGDRASGPLPQEAYVWQRAWSADVRQSVAQASNLALVALAAEVDLSHRPSRISRPAIDFATLRAHSRPVGLAIRIGSARNRGSANTPVWSAPCGRRFLPFR
ncbi:MAG TPA: hypothetical protein VF756_10035 [Thermoanaerobaculia bacterium]